jgi:hypothetical protein
MVTSIEWSEDSAEPRQSFAAEVDALKGKRLNPKELIGLLTLFARHPEPNAMGLDLQAFRDADLTGVCVVARLIAGKPPAPNGSVGWDVSQHVAVGNETVEGSSGGGGLDSYAQMKDWEGLESGIERALSASAETPFAISARIVGGGGTRITRPGR